MRCGREFRFVGDGIAEALRIEKHGDASRVASIRSRNDKCEEVDMPR